MSVYNYTSDPDEEDFRGKPKSTTLGRVIWKKYCGEIPKGYEIHHIDGDTKNDRIENLKCVSRKEHRKLHKNMKKKKKNLYHK